MHSDIRWLQWPTHLCYSGDYTRPRPPPPSGTPPPSPRPPQSWACRTHTGSLACLTATGTEPAGEDEVIGHRSVQSGQGSMHWSQGWMHSGKGWMHSDQGPINSGQINLLRYGIKTLRLGVKPVQYHPWHANISVILFWSNTVHTIKLFLT